jgi:hypothetical protein
MTEMPPSSAGSSSPPALSVTGLSSPSLKEVLIEDFRQHCTNLQNQYTRMHGRMQLITGLNTALLPALGALAVAASRDEVGHGWLLLFPAAGLLLSIIGYVAGPMTGTSSRCTARSWPRRRRAFFRRTESPTPRSTRPGPTPAAILATSRTLFRRAPQATVLEVSRSPRGTSRRRGGSG